MAVLETKGATMRFGGLTAVDSLSLRVDNREIVAVIGPNGAGKTTAFNMITGVYRPTEGEIFFSDTCISRKRPDQIARLGVEEGTDLTMLLPAVKQSAIDGAESTKNMVAVKGRAYYQADRSINHIDPGAVTMSYQIGILMDYALEHLTPA